GGFLRTPRAAGAGGGPGVVARPPPPPPFLAGGGRGLADKTPAGAHPGPPAPQGAVVCGRERGPGGHPPRPPAPARGGGPPVTPAEMPYDVGTGGLRVHPIYDTGDYPALLETALAAIDYEGFRREQAGPHPPAPLSQAWERGRARTPGSSSPPPPGLGEG